MTRYKHNHDCPFEAFVTNLGKYNEGELVGEWVKFPTTKEHLLGVFKRIGIGAKDKYKQPYEEWFISDYDIYVDGLVRAFEGNESIEQLDLIAQRIVEMTENEYQTFNNLLKHNEINNSIDRVLELLNQIIFKKNKSNKWLLKQ